jgi:hypothetical protein
LHCKTLDGHAWVFLGSEAAVWFVIDLATSVRVGNHETITVVVRYGIDGAVDGDHIEMRAEAVTLCVRVGEDSSLKDSVVGELDSGDVVARGEC